MKSDGASVESDASRARGLRAEKVSRSYTKCSSVRNLSHNVHKGHKGFPIRIVLPNRRDLCVRKNRIGVYRTNKNAAHDRLPIAAALRPTNLIYFVFASCRSFIA